MREVGYDGALSVECVAPVDRTPVSPYPGQVEKAPADIPADQLKFIEEHGSHQLSDTFYTSLFAKSAETLLPLIA